MRIGELFRHRLENAEVIPDPSVGINLMKRVARQEFLRFDLSRFNIYYLGAILMAGISAGVIFFDANTETAMNNMPEPATIVNDTLEKENPASGNENMASVKESENDDAAAAEVRERGETAAPVAVRVPETAGKTIADSARTVIREEAEVKPKEEVRIVEYSKYQDGFRTVVPKTSYTRRNAPAREKVNIHTVVIEDSSATRQIINNALPGKDNLKGEKGGNEPVAGASATEGCPPLEINFSNQTGKDGASKWTFGDKGTSEESNPSFTFSEDGEHNVMFEHQSGDGTVISSLISVLVYPKPEALFGHFPVENLFAGEEVRFRNLSVNAVSYLWDFGDGSTSPEFEPVHKYKKAGDYKIQLIVESDYGCADTLSLMRKVLRKR
jgi:hypothetical protein